MRDFRSYEALDLRFTADAVVLVGPNGAGKTNLLEALSMMGPGRGMRRAVAADLARQSGSGGWGAGIDVGEDDDITALSLRLEPPAPFRKHVHLDGQPVASTTTFANYIRFLWLTPAQDRLFTDSPGDRRRFLDRMTLAREAGHAAESLAYEKAMRQRQAVLAQNWDTELLSVLETQMAQHGLRVMHARQRTVAALAMGYGQIRTGAFPGAELALSGAMETRLAGGEAPSTLEDELKGDWQRGRRRDAEAGRALNGPHRADLDVTHAEKAQAARLCSTGEQKALLVGLVLAHAAALTERAEAPLVLLLDEISAHLDEARRGALAEILDQLDVQVFMTGTDIEPFAPWAHRAAAFSVENGRLQTVTV